MSKPARKPNKWVSSAKRDLDAMPEDVKDVFGHVIDLAQAGGKHQDAKVMTGFGSAGVLEGRGPPGRHLPGRLHRQVRRLGLCPALLPEEVQKRHSHAEAGHGFDQHPLEGRETGFRGLAGKARSTQMNEHASITIEEGSTNVYADLGYTDAAEMQRKSQLAGEVARAIKARRLTQEDAAALLGIDQSKVSRITRGQFRGVSEAKLLELVARLGHDVKIVVGPVRRRAGKIELQFA
jgi:predicted XRE-type DNA-binding protein